MKSNFFYGYVIVICAFSLQALGLGMFNSFGVFINPLTIEFNWSRALLTGAVSITYVITALAGILFGRINDRFGPRLIMTVCGIFLGAGYFFMSRVGSLVSFYIYCCLFIGIGMGGTDVVLLSTVARWFIKKRGIMSGIVKVGTGFGMLVMPLLMNRLIMVHGWRTTLWILGIIALGLYFLFSQFLYRDPFVMGLSPDGNSRESLNIIPDTEEGLGFSSAVRTRQFWTINSSYFLFYTCSNTIMIHIVPHAIDLGLSPGNAAMVFSVLGALSVAGRLIMGAAGDRFGNRAAYGVCFLCLITGLIWLQFSTRMWMLIIFAIIHGFAHGGNFAVISPLLAQFFGTVSHGFIFGIVIFTASIGGAAGPITAGYIFDVRGEYGITFRILTSFAMAGLFAIFSLKNLKKK
jgi:MFS family permease